SCNLHIFAPHLFAFVRCGLSGCCGTNSRLRSEVVSERPALVTEKGKKMTRQKDGTPQIGPAF
ncbi:hypothetical protein, partial [Novipirellula rosea]|uniref:hypothetical protein n=1 Tax=Novipirellula rosea TaxID=1031540 RepID=UPI0031EA2D65